MAGIIGIGLGSLFYIAAVEEAGAGKTAVLTSTMPLFNLPLAVLFLKERVTPRIVARDHHLRRRHMAYHMNRS